MSQADAGISRILSSDPIPSETNGIPTSADLASMWDALPRPELTDYAAWLAEGVEAAAEVRAFERSRAGLMRHLFGEVA
jgi:hypothetical protein